MSNIPNRVIDVTECGKLGNSDHAMIETTIHGSLSLHIPRHQVWDFKKAKFDEMKDKLKNIEWNGILINNLETDWQIFKDIFINICNYVPRGNPTLPASTITKDLIGQQI